MFREMTSVTIFLSLAACASNPATTDAPIDATPATATQSAATQQSESQVAAVESAPAADTQDTSESGLHVIEVPTVASTAPQAAAQTEAHPDELICRRFKVTGSHRMQKVCRTRAEIEQARRDGQKMVRGVMSTPDGIRANDRTAPPTRPGMD